MKSDIRHSGAVNKDPRFTFQLIELRHSTISVRGDVASLCLQITEAELRDLIARGQAALEEMRLRGLFDSGALTFEEYEAAMSATERRAVDELTAEAERLGMYPAPKSSEEP